jgi:hypothetical protein
MARRRGPAASDAFWTRSRDGLGRRLVVRGGRTPLIRENWADRKALKRHRVIPLSSRGKSPAYEGLVKNAKVTSAMSDQFDTSSELVEISRLNGSFKRNYGRFIGAYLYLRSIRAARGGSLFWPGVISIATALVWLARHGLVSLHVY